MARRKGTGKRSNSNNDPKNKSNYKPTDREPSQKGGYTKEESKDDSRKGDNSSTLNDKPTGLTEKGGGARSTNDPEWYARDPQLLLDSASFPYAYPLGDPILFDNGIPNGTGFKAKHGNNTLAWGIKSRSAIPGICSLRAKPTIGWTLTRNDPANVCANAFYTHVRYVNSGRKNYDPADLMMYALTIADIYSFVFWCQRLYGYMYTYSQRNKYIAQALVEANGVDFNSMLANLANFRYWLNSFINKVSAWAVPADIAIFKRRSFMYANLYLENGDANIKDQLYQFVPDGFYRFGLDANDKGMLEYTILPTVTPMTVADIMTFANNLIANITGDEDFGLMSGDIIKAYEGNIIGLATMPEEVFVIPVHDEYVLSQFKNANIMGSVSRGANAVDLINLSTNYVVKSGDVYQDNTGNIICMEAMDHNTAVWTDELNLKRAKMISVASPTPGPADSIEASRLMIGYEQQIQGWVYDDDHTKVVPIMYSGTEIIVSCIFSKFQEINSGLQLYHFAIGNQIVEFTGNSVVLGAAQLAFAFKYSPQLIGAYITVDALGSGHDELQEVQQLSDIDNYTIIGTTEIAKMHECALLSLFFVPGVAKIVNYAN